MKLKTVMACAVALVMLMGSCAHQSSVYTPGGKHFTNEVLNRMTPIKDQGERDRAPELGRLGKSFTLLYREDD